MRAQRRGRTSWVEYPRTSPDKDLNSGCYERSAREPFDSPPMLLYLEMIPETTILL